MEKLDQGKLTVTNIDLTTKRILAVDPGITSGIAAKYKQDTYITSVCTSEEDVWDFVNPDTCDVVLYEEFKATKIDRYGLQTVRVIGGIRALCNYFKIPIFRQQPQQRRSFIPIARKYLQQNKGDRFKVHETDALSHIMYYEYVNGLRKFDVLQAATIKGGKVYRGL